MFNAVAADALTPPSLRAPTEGWSGERTVFEYVLSAEKNVMIKRALLAIAFVIGWWSPAVAADRVLSVDELSETIKTAAPSARWRPYCVDLRPAQWIWLPSQRTLPNSFVLFRRELDFNDQAAQGRRLDHGRQPLPVDGQRPAGAMGAGPVRPAGSGRRSVRLTALAAGARTLSASRCSTTASATAPGRPASRA